MAIKPLELTPIDIEQLHTNNLLCNRDLTFVSQIYQTQTIFTLMPIITQRKTEMTLVLRIAGIDVPLQINRQIFSHVKIGNTILAEVIDQLPEPLLKGCLNLALERTLTDFRSLLQQDIQLQEIRFNTAKLSPALQLNLNIQDHEHACIIGFNPEFKNLIEQIPPSTPNDEVLHLPFNLIIEAGRTTLSAKQIHNLQIQDIILFDKNWHKDRQHCLLRLSQNTGFIVKINSGTLTLENWMEISMTEDLENLGDLDNLDHDLEQQETQAPATTMPDINNIPVQLTFDLGSQEMPFSNLSKLTPGFALQINRPLASPVIINANGKPFAEGELVDINGQLGTRIIKIL